MCVLLFGSLFTWLIDCPIGCLIVCYIGFLFRCSIGCLFVGPTVPADI